MQKILGNMRKAIQDYNMIQDGDKIAVGLSGGKDSVILLNALYRLKQFLPINFDIMAITIDPGFDNFDTSYLKDLCYNLGIEYVIYDSHIKDIVFDIRNEKNPCSLCANLRRGMLNSVAIEHGCNKIALGHHMDDVIETLFLSLFYEGHIHTFSPVTYLSRSNIYLIRPMIYVEEKQIKSVINKSDFKIMNKCCSQDGFTKREYMKDLFKKLILDIPNVRSNIFGAIKRSNIKGWNIEGGNDNEE